jgi:hypothetical protein
LYVVSLFSSAFKILCIWHLILWLQCVLGMVLFELILAEICWIEWICRLIISSILTKFPVIISLNICLLLSFCYSCDAHVGIPGRVHRSLRLCSFFIFFPAFPTGQLQLSFKFFLSFFVVHKKRAYTLNDSSSPFFVIFFFEIGSLGMICWGWLWIMILLIFAQSR